MKRVCAFLKNNKNKIILYSILFLLLLSVVYFIGSIDEAALKGLVFLLCALTYVGVFFGVKFAVFMQSKLGAILAPKAEQSRESATKAKKILSAAAIIISLAEISMCVFEFAATLGGFSLVVCSCFSAVFCAFIYLM